MSPLVKKFILSFTIGLLLMPAVYLAFRPEEPREAQAASTWLGSVLSGVGGGASTAVSTLTPLKNQTIGDIPKVLGDIGDALSEVLTSVGYTILKKSLQLGVEEGIHNIFNYIAAGAPGQKPLYEQRPLGQLLLDVAADAGSTFISATAIAIDKRITETQRLNDEANADYSGLSDQMNQIQADSTLYRCDTLAHDVQCASALSAERGGARSAADCTPDQNYVVTLDERQAECPKIEQRKVANEKAFQTTETNLDTKLHSISSGAEQAKFLLSQQGAVSPGAAAIASGICNLDPTAALGMLKFALPAPTIQAQPLCSVQQAWTHWSTLITNSGVAATNGEAWRAIADMVTPNSSDLGTTFRYILQLDEEQKKAAAIAEAQRTLINPQGKDVANKAGKTLTPFDVVADVANKYINDSTSINDKFTGHLIADVATTILNSLADGVIQMIRRGIAVQGGGNSSLYSSSSASYQGLAAVQQRNSSLIKAKFSGDTSLQILDELQNTDCGSSLNACVISSNFASAIDQGITLRDAMSSAKNLLNDGMAFGFTSESSEPPYQTGLPYRSLVILRKYRVIPVSWELAALYIQKHIDSCPEVNGGHLCTLGYLKDQFSVTGSPFYGMINPDWVLKIPENICRVQGAGPNISPLNAPSSCKFDTNGDGQICCAHTCSGTQDSFCVEQCPYLDEPVKETSRQDACVDDQSCLEQKSDGTCKEFGYCLQERSTWKFAGTSCDPVYDSCTTYTSKATNQRVSYLASSVSKSSGSCSPDVAGCTAYSATRENPKDTTNQDWSDTDLVHFTRSAKQCSADAEGCRALVLKDPTGDKTVGLRLAPASYKCDEPGAYARPECKRFALSCQGWKGCEQYAPTDGSQSVAGVGATQCSPSCNGFMQYFQSPTAFEQQSEQFFIGSAAQQCSAQAVGCDQYTNLDVGEGRAGEAVAYFSQVQMCVPKPAVPDVFYSWEGSDVNGYTLATYNLAVEVGGSGPRNGTRQHVGSCDATTYKAQFTGSKPGDIICKEFFNTRGQVFYRFADNLIYETDDCHPYRNDNVEGASQVSISPALSRSCGAAENKCREYRATSAGDLQTLVYDDFEYGDNAGWEGGVNSSDAVVFQGNSLSVQSSASKVVSLGEGDWNYELKFISSAAEGTTITAELYDGKGSNAKLIGSFGTFGQKVNDWDSSIRKMAFPNTTRPDLSGKNLPDTGYLKFTGSAPFFIDNLSLSRAQGVIYAIKDSWTTNPTMQQCQVAITSAGGPSTQLNCRTYNDRAGTLVAFSTFDKSCPLEMIGCKDFTNEADETVSLVDDEAKSCNVGQNASEENERDCSAYGVKNTNGSGWNTTYFKITPEQAKSTTLTGEKSKWLCPATAVQCDVYNTVDLKGVEGSEVYFKDPGNKVCSVVEGNWVAKQCAKTGNYCSDDSDCSSVNETQNGQQVNVNTCSAIVACDESKGFIKSCPAEQNTCRAISDPACVVAEGRPASESYLSFSWEPNANNYGRGGNGAACQKDYYYLEDINDQRGACNGSVNPDKGCLLFRDTAEGGSYFKASDVYKKYRSNPGQSIDIASSNAGVSNDTDTTSGNVILKVDVDRQCKTWLACTSAMQVGSNVSNDKQQQVCFTRRPCDAMGPNGECTHWVDNADPALASIQRSSVAANGGPLYAGYLSGLSRPDFAFDNVSTPFVTTGGHDGYFEWQQSSEPGSFVKDDATNPFGRLLTKLTANSGVAQGLPTGGIVNSCRLYPQNDAPINATITGTPKPATWSRLTYDANGNLTSTGRKTTVDACYYSDQNLDLQRGVYGYCLEPYPGTDNQVAYTKDHANVAVAGYTNACLNWYPSTYIQGQYDTLGKEEAFSAYSGPKPLYYCLASAGPRNGFDLRPAYTNTISGYAVKTRDSSIFRAALGWGNLKRRREDVEIRDTSTMLAAIENVPINTTVNTKFPFNVPEFTRNIFGIRKTDPDVGVFGLGTQTATVGMSISSSIAYDYASCDVDLSGLGGLTTIRTPNTNLNEEGSLPAYNKMGSQHFEMPISGDRLSVVLVGSSTGAEGVYVVPINCAFRTGGAQGTTRGRGQASLTVQVHTFTMPGFEHLKLSVENPRIPATIYTAARAIYGTRLDAGDIYILYTQIPNQRINDVGYSQDGFVTISGMPSTVQTVTCRLADIAAARASLKPFADTTSYPLTHAVDVNAGIDTVNAAVAPVNSSWSGRLSLAPRSPSQSGAADLAVRCEFNLTGGGKWGQTIYATGSTTDAKALKVIGYNDNSLGNPPADIGSTALTVDTRSNEVGRISTIWKNTYAANRTFWVYSNTDQHDYVGYNYQLNAGFASQFALLTISDIKNVSRVECDIGNTDRLAVENNAKIRYFNADASRPEGSQVATGWTGPGWRNEVVGVYDQNSARVNAVPVDGKVAWWFWAKPLDKGVKGDSKDINMHCKFYGTDGSLTDRRLPFDVATFDDSYFAVNDGFFKKIAATVNSWFSVAWDGVKKVASGVKNSVVALVDQGFGAKFSIAAQGNYSVVKPRMIVTSPDGVNAEGKPIVKFTLAEVRKGLVKKVKVEASSDLGTTSFRWRAVLDDAKTEIIPRSNVGTYSWLKVLTDQPGGVAVGNNGDTFDIGFNSEWSLVASGGVHRGVIRVYSMSPLEGIYEGANEQDVVVEVDGSQGAATFTPRAGEVPDEQPQEFIIADDTFYPSINYKDLREDLNYNPTNDTSVGYNADNDPKSRMNKNKVLKNGAAPLYPSDSVIKLTLNKDSAPTPCHGDDKLQVRLIYRYEGDATWRSNPQSTYEQGANGYKKIDSWRDITCDRLDSFTWNLPDDDKELSLLKNTTGIQYYFVLNNRTTGKVHKSEYRYIDIQFNEIKDTSTPNIYTDSPSSAKLQFSLFNSPVVGQADAQIGWKDYYYTSSASSCKDGGSSYVTKEYHRTYSIVSVDSSSLPSAAYCGPDYKGGDCEEIKWLNDAPEAKIVEKGGSGNENGYSTSNAIYLSDTIKDIENVKKKLLPLPNANAGYSNSYSGNIKVHVDIKGTITNVSCGVARSSSDNSSYDEPPYSASLFVRPKMDIPSEIKLTVGDAGRTRAIPIKSNPVNVSYRWHAKIKSMDPIPRKQAGFYQNWLTITPREGSSGMDMDVTLNSDVAPLVTLDKTYKAIIQVYAISPVEGTIIQEIPVTLNAEKSATLAKVRIAEIGEDYKYKYSTKYDNSMLILDSGNEPAYVQDTGVRLETLNKFEQGIKRDQIAAIKYVIEHKTRDTLPGFDFVNAGAAEVARQTLDQTRRTQDLTKDHIPGFTNSYDEYKKLIDQFPPLEIVADANNDYTMLIRNQQASDVETTNIWTSSCGGPKQGGVGRDFAGLKPIFDQKGELRNWQWRYCDSSDDSVALSFQYGGQVIWVSIVIYLKDYCTDIAQVVAEDGQTIPWATKLDNLNTAGAPRVGASASQLSKLGGQNYSGGVCATGYGLDLGAQCANNSQCGSGTCVRGDYSPMNPPPGRPDQWPAPVDVIHDSNPNIATADPLFTPAAKHGYCLGGSNTGGDCSDNLGCPDQNSSGGYAQCVNTDGPLCVFGPNLGRACSNNNDCGQGGACFGNASKTRLDGNGNSVTQPIEYFNDGLLKAKQLVNDYFAKAYGYWRWNAGTRRYEFRRDQLWGPPDIGTLKILNKSGAPGFDFVKDPDGRTTHVSFYSEVDPDHLPLTSIQVSWGDGVKNSIQLSSKDRPYTGGKPRGQHEFVHTYPASSNPDANSICITIKDNWGKTVSSPANCSQ